MSKQQQKNTRALLPTVTRFNEPKPTFPVEKRLAPPVYGMKLCSYCHKYKELGHGCNVQNPCRVFEKCPTQHVEGKIEQQVYTCTYIN